LLTRFFFLNQFSVPKKDLTKIKKEIIDLLSTLKNHQLIEDQFSLTYKNGSYKKVKHLTPLMLTKSEYVSFYEKII